MANLLLLASIWIAAALQDGPPRRPRDNHRCPEGPPPQSQIDKAVAAGVEFLRPHVKKTDLELGAHGGHTLEELILAALAYGGLKDDHSDVQELLRHVLRRSPAKTYETVLLMIALDKLDREFYLWKIVECAQFLVENQCENGQWSYGEPIQLSPQLKRTVETLKIWGQKARLKRRKGNGSTTKTKLQIRLRGKPQRPQGDNSNTQFAAVGLWIASEAGVIFPTDLLLRARRWWLTEQYPDGGWGYMGRSRDRGEPYLSMTAGGVSSLSILQAILDAQARKKNGSSPAVATAIKKGSAWLAKEFTFYPRMAVLMRAPYTHYSIERAGILSQQDRFGPHPWYAEGCFDLIKRQRKDGSWRLSRRGRRQPQGRKDERTQWAIIDTAIAILFFKRSVRPPVATGGPKK